ncbi:UDP-galactopyranose mutase [Bifidobacterium animalis subsp. lactis]|uniref:UDP-galactopyranose mutase n=1 Tax=Bifidobacterium animalis TaxID=28025 RepID=UPI001EE6929A|nr:UDP-galactopyranose mutase [Bifidobacterium animalis]
MKDYKIMTVSNNAYSAIYVVCLAYSKSGGPELLHQLVHVLNNNGVKAIIAYTAYNKEDKLSPVNAAFKKYVKKYCLFEQIPDRADSIVVFPEVNIEDIHFLKNATKYCWWLSVDNYLKRYNLHYIIKNKLTRYFLTWTKHGFWRYGFSYIRKNVSKNLVQSYYAEDYLKKRGFTNIVYLSDYINEEYQEDTSISYRNNAVLYNPKKGIEFTRQLIEAAPDLNWVPLENMSNEEVRGKLKTSKVYIDFGDHPGKDRFPREAAISGCCVITGKRGSAAYDDVPIPEEYQFEDSVTSIPAIVETIRECLVDYDRRMRDFDGYRSTIKAEKNKFIEDVRSIFMH